MFKTSQSISRLMDELAKMPGIGPKTAQRLAFYILKIPAQEALSLAAAIQDVKEKVRYCSTCFNLTEEDPCAICRDATRDSATICVVEEANDLLALEKTNEYRGLYHVLGGALSPLDGIGPDDLHINELLDRLPQGIEEVILATNPNVEGEATALYLRKLLKPFNIIVTRVARGLPVGGDLEYADQATLTRALEDRVAL
ncbi:recombination protein RecR [bacterium]|nr:recombination protein RecR [bacterium]